MNIFHYWPTLAKGLQDTLEITALSFLIAIVAAVPVVGMRISRFRVLRTIGAIYVQVLRGIPPLTWMFVVYFGLPTYNVSFSPMTAAIVVLGLVYSSYMVEVYRGGLRAVPLGQGEAAYSLGLSPVTVYRKVVGPQAFRTALPPATAYLVALLKDSALASTLGVLDVTARALTQGQSSPHSLTIFVSAAVLYMAFSVPAGMMSRRLSRTLQTPRSGR